MIPTLAEVIAFLSRERIRATYGAVAGVLGVAPHSIGERLGPRCARVSWIVNAATHQPVDFRPDELAPDLATNPAVIEWAGATAHRASRSRPRRRRPRAPRRAGTFHVNCPWV
jgi:hypothetical protein